MPKGISLHIGLNQVDPNYYNGWNGGPLAGCVNDARDMQAVAVALGYQSTVLTDSQATAAAVVRAIGQAAQQLDGGDIFLLTYSGHGGQIKDVNSDERDGQDETWVLWDRELLDDELYRLWAQFRAGGRIFVLSDSCHSGTVTRVRLFNELVASAPFAREYGAARAGGPAFRFIPTEVQAAVVERDYEMYETLQWVAGGRAEIGASVLLISGCQDNQLSLDGARNGLFTETLLRVWNDGAFNGDYAAFHHEVVSRMPPTQTPNYYLVGSANAAFESERPGAIGGGTNGGGVKPAIQGPNSISRATQPPVFTVNPGANRYYVVEVATRPELFNYAANSSRRNDSNFFGSWRTAPFSFAWTYPAIYELPLDVWDRLRGAGRLFYRLWATDSPNSWVNQTTTTPDDIPQGAPFIEIVGGADVPANVPSIIAPSSVPNSPTLPRFQVNPGPGRYYAIEVATRPELFNLAANGSQRNDDNFFGSWRTTPFGAASVYPASYDLPSRVWERLRRNAGQIYYRLWATDSQNNWVNHVASTPDADAAKAPTIRMEILQ